MDNETVKRLQTKAEQLGCRLILAEPNQNEVIIEGTAVKLNEHRCRVWVIIQKISGEWKDSDYFYEEGSDLETRIVEVFGIIKRWHDLHDSIRGR